MTPNNNARPVLATRGPGEGMEQNKSYSRYSKHQYWPAIRAAIDALRVYDGQVFELRALEVPTRYKPVTVAGWFDDYDAMALAAAELDLRRAPAVYLTLNPVNPQLLGRACNHLIECPRATTADHDVIRRTWLPLDIDPVRPSLVSATPEQIQKSAQRADGVADWLQEKMNLSPDLRGFSGNGHHLLYRVDLPNTEESTSFIRNLIESVATRFDDDAIKIDRTVFNPARIWKLYGTMARKGEEVPRLGMFHRRAELLDREGRTHD